MSADFGPNTTAVAALFERIAATAANEFWASAAAWFRLRRSPPDAAAYDAAQTAAHDAARMSGRTAPLGEAADAATTASLEAVWAASDPYPPNWDIAHAIREAALTAVQGATLAVAVGDLLTPAQFADLTGPLVEAIGPIDQPEES